MSSVDREWFDKTLIKAQYEIAIAQEIRDDDVREKLVEILSMDIEQLCVDYRFYTRISANASRMSPLLFFLPIFIMLRVILFGESILMPIFGGLLIGALLVLATELLVVGKVKPDWAIHEEIGHALMEQDKLDSIREYRILYAPQVLLDYDQLLQDRRFKTLMNIRVLNRVLNAPLVYPNYERRADELREKRNA